MDIFPSFRIVTYRAVSSIVFFVSEKQTVSTFRKNTASLMKFCKWEFQDGKFDKVTFVQEILVVPRKQWFLFHSKCFL